MILFKKTGDLTRWLDRERAAGKSIGFVPTMGALHEGHISLIAISKKTTANPKNGPSPSSLTVCSIFVNPTQFNDPKDFQKYPITLEKDIVLLEKAGVDILFLPGVEEVYPQGTKDLEKYDLGRLETLLEGKYRPGHFQGVSQVMRRLLELVRPDDLFMGAKDYQQCMVVQRLIGLMGWKIRLHRCPILREADGLAMSSRNVRLNPEERQRATAIYKALLAIKENWGDVLADEIAIAGEAVLTRVLTEAVQLLADAQFRVDYVEVADADTLEPVEPGAPNAVALIAAFQGEVRLIDNMILS